MTYQIPPKIAIINSFAGYGRCSMTEALPIISVMGVQACPVPTSVFSNHTGFSTHYCQDFTEQMPAYLAQWDRLGIVFDGIYCGFLGRKEQIPVVADFILRQKEKGCSTVLVDPVMGDHGKPFRTITIEHCKALSALVRCADIITPNITEACLLTDTPYREDDWNADQLQALADTLHRFGPNKIAVTGLMHNDANGCPDGFINFISQLDPSSQPGIGTSRYAPITGSSRHGTGDIFASILAADAVLGKDLTASVTKAADFIGACIQLSDQLQIPETDGVCFENLLHMLL